jgi:hypothetical protein
LARFHDSLVWKWVVGPAAYGAIVAVAYAVIFDEAIAAGLAFGAFMALVVLARVIIVERRRGPADMG